MHHELYIRFKPDPKLDTNFILQQDCKKHFLRTIFYEEFDEF